MQVIHIQVYKVWNYRFEIQVKNQVLEKTSGKNWAMQQEHLSFVHN